LAKYVVTGNNVSFDGVDISASVTRAELAISSTEVDVTDFASGGWTEVVGGLKSGSISIDFQQDFGTGGIGETLTEDLVGTIKEVIIIAGNGSVASATTPSYTASCLISSVTPVSGAVGDLSTYSVTWATTGPIVKAVA
tara:strand:+ start:614 stop:1030 length:417 start_codon:yes stop_codon:yes gene_type:complete